MATKGRTLRVKACATSGGSFNNVAGIESASYDRDGVSVEVTELTDADIKRIQTIKDAKISMSGNYESGDTNGQVLIDTQYEAGSTVFLEFLPGGTTGWKQEFVVEKISVSGSVKDKQAVSFEFASTGAKSTV